jgi:hypothetical protein
MKTPFTVPTSLLLTISILIGAYQFFHPVHPIAQYLTSPQRVFLADNYWTFADSIFQPQSVPWAESILMPLLAKLLGATSDLLAFQFLSVFLTLCILPVFCLMLQQQVKNSLAVLLGIVIFAVTFRFLPDHILGSPDPLTIILILLAAGSQKKAVTLYIFLAGLSHFSLAVVAAIAMLPLHTLAMPSSESKLTKAKYLFAGLVLSKITLIAWYWMFDYHLFSRWDFIIDKGLSHFWQLFINNPIAFLYTPGRVFGLISLLIMGYLLFKRSYAAVFGYCFALAVTYLALFITLDGLRIFSVVIVGAYFHFLVCWLNCLFNSRDQSKSVVAPALKEATQ